MKNYVLILGCFSKVLSQCFDAYVLCSQKYFKRLLITFSHSHFHISHFY